MRGARAAAAAAPASFSARRLHRGAAMATPNNLTPTNCSWWPISALESDAAKPAEAPAAPQAASPAHWPKESLVLYHWTQSFSSQKVLGARRVDWGGGPGGDSLHLGPQMHPLSSPPNWQPPSPPASLPGRAERQRGGEGRDGWAWRRGGLSGRGALQGREKAPAFTTTPKSAPASLRAGAPCLLGRLRPCSLCPPGRPAWGLQVPALPLPPTRF